FHKSILILFAPFVFIFLRVLLLIRTCKEHINDFPQAGSGKIILKYAADNICIFFMYDDFLANQNIAIWKFHSYLAF
ncbi:hypothetical protein D1641_15425, partial [Colidextribacter sp. OB.20]|nr:hypothetical protein [Colidextribacter sp. OB.20]